MTTDDMTWPQSAGPLLGRYELLGIIGRGGMGTVSRARDLETGGLVAVKRVRGMEARARREAAAVSRLRHPSIVRLLEAAETEDGWILVSELVDGADLRRVLQGGQLAPRDVARFAGSVARGLEHAHAAGIVHRDVKPANVLCPVDPRAAGAWAKLTDFGVAALAGDESLTVAGDVLGTLAYMAPEQARGERVEPPADVFALAVLVYEALAGVNPRRGATPAETAARAARGLPPLATYRPDLPARVLVAVDRCLDTDPHGRGDLAQLDDGLHQLAGLDGGSGRGLRPRAPQPPPAPAPALTAVRARPEAAHPGTAARPASSPPPVERPRRAWTRPVRRAPAPGRPAPVPVEPDAGEAPAAAASPRRLPRLPERLLAAAGACVGLLVMVDAAAAPQVLALAGVLAALLPRVTWTAGTTAAAVLIVRDDPLAAGVVVAAGVLPALLLPHRGALWPVAGIAAGFTAVGLPGAWPALAALAPTPWRRAALGAHGAMAAAATAFVAQSPVLQAPATDDPAELAAAFAGPLLVAFAAGAVLLPLVIRGRAIGADLVAAAGWSGALGGVLAGAALADPTLLLWAGPAAGALLLVGLRAVQRAAPDRRPEPAA